jgi:peptidyl-prolyl cis-trans isomerase D
MLKSIRKATGSWATKGVLIVIALSFALWGVGDIFRGGGPPPVAEVGEYDISLNAFSREFGQAKDFLQRQTGKIVTDDEARAQGLDSQVLLRMVGDALLEQEAEHLGLTVPDGVIQDEIMATSAFWDERGNFDRERYRQLLAQNGFSPADYEETLRRDRVRRQLTQTIAAAPSAPHSWAGALHRYRGEKRVVEYILVPSNAQKDIGEPDEAELVAFHQENAARFTAPEYRAVSFVELKPDLLLGEIELSDDDLYFEYESRIAEFYVPEQRRVEQLLAPNEALRDEIRDKLQAGVGFRETGEALANKGVTHVAFDYVTERDLLPEVSPTVFALSRGGVSNPIETSFGWHFFWVRDAVAPHTKPFDEVRDMIHAEYAAELALDGLYQLANRFQDELAAGAALEEAAFDLGLPFVQFQAIDANGRTPDGTRIENLPDPSGFIERTFTTPEGMESDLAESPGGNYYILRVDEVIPATLRPLDTVRDEVVAAWKASHEQQSAARRAQDAVDRLSQGDSLEELADDLSLAVETSPPLTRDGKNAGLLGPALRNIFELNPSGVDAVSAPVAEGYLVVRVIEVQHADLDAKAIRRITDELTESLTAEMYAQYQVALQRRYPARVNFDILNSIFQ